jgi:hypothetical protein
MKHITVIAHDRKGNEIQSGDIIKNDYGVQTVVFFHDVKRCYLAYDMAPFPVSITEAEIKENFEIIGNVGERPDFKPVYEVDIFHAQRDREREVERERSFVGWMKRLIFN